MKMSLALALLASFVAVPMAVVSAMAQTGAPVSRTIPVTFSGVVTNDVTNSIRIRQPDGSFANFTGPVPDYPYKVGDPVSISFNATVPTQAFYRPGGPYQGQLAADGIYRIGVGQQTGVGTGFNPVAGVGAISNPDVSGPISPNANSLPTSVRMTIVYDANADNYSLEFPNGSWNMFSVNGPAYSYNPDTGALTSTTTSCPGSGCSEQNRGGFAISGTATTAAANNVGIFNPQPSSTQPSIAGLFDLLFSGSWSLPTYGGGGATQVPEPGMMFLFGGGAAALMARRRRRKSA